MFEILTDEQLHRLHEEGLGLIYNDFSRRGSSGGQNNILHAAHCPWLLQSNVNVRKIFFTDLQEARTWLTDHRGEEGVNWKRCGTCEASGQPAERRVGDQELRGAGPTPSGTPADPFTEAEVQGILVQYLRREGYETRKGVPCSSGLIDLVAKRAGRPTVIEVKGEDKGGYTSAEMNFQIGIGQIVSRMTEYRASYALAVPVTDDFLRVLRKYRGSFGLSRLGLHILLVHKDGHVEPHTPECFAVFLETL